jgi:tRNA dimethylallyltransferase
MRGIPHHLLDVVSPKKIFTAADFALLASQAIDEIQDRERLPIICGGTGFYIDVLLGRIDIAEVTRDERLWQKLRAYSADALFTLLQKTDPARARKMNESDRQNPVRLVRAIEIASHAHRGTSKIPHQRSAGEILWAGLMPSQAILREKIHTRLMSRMKTGMVREVQMLHARGLSWKRMEELGLEYRYLARYQRGMCTKEKMLADLEIKITQYARRQSTYWKRNKDIHWFKDSSEALLWIKKQF